MTKHFNKLPVAIATAAALALAASSPTGWAEDHDDDDDEIPFDVAEVFFELNDTDGDLGIHGKVDGGPWTKVKIEDPNERRMMVIRANGRLRRQGVTELFFESAEPTFDELPPHRFFRRFPEGIYEVEGRSQDGEELESETEVTHVMPAPPAASVNGVPMATQCDDEKLGYDETVVAAGVPVTIKWEKVTMSHPDRMGGGAGVQPPVKVEIHNYEVVAEVELEVNGEEFASVFSVILPPEQRSITLPADFIALGDTFKYEVLAREASYNQTAVESCFVID